jgi:hypothetical protein
MLTELEVLKDVSGRLERAGFEYMLTGSVAMNYYAEPRMTRDLDIVVALGADDIPRLREAFADGYYVPEAEELKRAVRSPGMFNLVHLDAVVKVDMVVRKSEPYRQAEFARRQEVELGDFRTWIASKEDLILSKLVWAKDSASPLQLGDVRKLLAAGADMDYLWRWAGSLGVAELLEKCLHE